MLPDPQVSGAKPGEEHPFGGASVIILRRDAVLMIQRARAPFLGLWSFPGGHCEPDEASETTARRELAEETGIAADRLLHLGSFQPDPALLFRIAVFAGRAGVGEPKPGDDARRAEFVPFVEVLNRAYTPGAPGWIAGALARLSGLDDRPLR